MITRNVASKHYCLSQVLMAALLLVSRAALLKSYPDPLECNKYFLRIDNDCYHLTCPNNLTFDQNTEQCTLTATCNRNISSLNVTDCNQNNEVGYYCLSPTRFTYCIPGCLKIMENVNCPCSQICLGLPNTKPCVTC